MDVEEGLLHDVLREHAIPEGPYRVARNEFTKRKLPTQTKSLEGLCGSSRPDIREHEDVSANISTGTLVPRPARQAVEDPSISGFTCIRPQGFDDDLADCRDAHREWLACAGRHFPGLVVGQIMSEERALLVALQPVLGIDSVDRVEDVFVEIPAVGGGFMDRQKYEHDDHRCSYPHCGTAVSGASFLLAYRSPAHVHLLAARRAALVCFLLRRDPSKVSVEPGWRRAEQPREILRSGP